MGDDFTFYQLLLNIKDWIIFLVVISGAIISINTFRQTLKQRKLENTYRLLDFLRKHISQEYIEKFIELFQANNPISQPENVFYFSEDNIDYVESMFSEGGCGNGEIQNMIEIFNFISADLINNRYDIRYVWYEYGQLMNGCYKWTSQLEEIEKTHKQNDEEFYSIFNKFMKNKQNGLLNYPTKYYTYCE